MPDRDGLHGETITVITRTADPKPDEHGMPDYDIKRTVFDGCSVQPVTAAETPLFADATRYPRYRIIGPASRLFADLVSGDARIEWAGRLWIPAGSAFDWKTMDGLGNHTELYISPDNTTEVIDGQTTDQRH